MADNKWQGIWEAKARDFRGEPTLDKLLALGGYDSKTCQVDVDEWHRYGRYLIDAVGLTPAHTVYDVGCGCSAFLLLMQRAGCKVGGIDYSEGQVSIARQVLPAADLEIGDALSLRATPTYDFVMSSGAFVYFPNAEYAERVLTVMVAKARLGVAVLDVADSVHKEQSLATRRAAYPEGEYERLYAGLEHLYLPATWFRDFAERHGLRAVIVAQTLKRLNRSCYFNAFLFKS